MKASMLCWRTRMGGALLLAVLVTGVVGLAVPDLGWAQDTAADERAGRLLYQVNGEANGLSLVFDRRGLLALSPLLDVAFPRSRAQISNVAATARSSPSDPGLAGALGSIAPVLGFPPGLLPAYPLYADAAYPSGPAEAQVGVDMTSPVADSPIARASSGQATADEDHASADSTMALNVTSEPVEEDVAGRLGLDEVGSQVVGGLQDGISDVLESAGFDPTLEGDSTTLMRLGTMHSEVDVSREGLELRVRGLSRVADVSLLGGIFTIDAVRATAESVWSDPDEDPVHTVDTEVAGARLLGVPVAIVEGGGIRVLDQSVPASVTEQLNQLLKDQGAEIRIGPVVENEEGTSIEVAAISLDFLGSLTPALPPILPEEQDTLNLRLGSVRTSLSSQLLPAFETPATPAAPDASLTGMDVPSTDVGTTTPSASGGPPDVTLPEIPTVSGGGRSGDSSVPPPAVAAPDTASGGGQSDPIVQAGGPIELYGHVTAAPLARLSVLWLITCFLALTAMVAARFGAIRPVSP